jgi:sugar transferase (PEP-CTERM system associated)
MRLFRVFIPASVLALLLSEIALIIACYTVAALYTLNVDPVVYLWDEDHYWKILFVSLCIILGFYLQDLYTEFRIVSRIMLIQQVCLSVGAALLLMAMLGYIRIEWILPRWLMVIGSALVIILVPLWRMIYWKYVIRTLQTERVLLLGNSSILAETTEHVNARPELGYNILGYLCETEPVEFPTPCLGQISELKEVVAKLKPTRIVVGMAERRGRLPVQQLLEIRFEGIVIEDAADAYEMATRRVCSRKIQPSQLIFTSELGPRRQALALQNIYSFVLGLIGLVVLLPVMLIVALLVKMTSRGSVLYRQKRVGLNGHVFTVYKFRSMYSDAEARTGAVWAKKDDPRITPLGKWLRKLRLDELPQFWNVVTGDMALVGPRPERPEFVETLSQQIPYYRQRLAVKPGITGWAQINHKYGDTELDAMIKLEYDLYYIKHVAPALDAYIIFHTIKVMLLSRGAQ